MPTWLKLAGWAVTAAALAVYAVMVMVTLPHLAQLAGGMPMFDMRPGGYDFETARTILAALGDEGRGYYALVQHGLDALYPPLIGLTLCYWFLRAAPRWRRAGLPLSPIALGMLIGIGFMASAFDMTENAAVSTMLAAGPDRVTPDMVSGADIFTRAKSITATFAYSALLVMALLPFASRFWQRNERA